jgi:hypothetical protein
MCIYYCIYFNVLIVNNNMRFSYKKNVRLNNKKVSITNFFVIQTYDLNSVS